MNICKRTLCVAGRCLCRGLTVVLYTAEIDRKLKAINEEAIFAKYFRKIKEKGGDKVRTNGGDDGDAYIQSD